MGQGIGSFLDQIRVLLLSIRILCDWESLLSLIPIVKLATKTQLFVFSSVADPDCIQEGKMTHNNRKKFINFIF
jgi:hypothetical protein